MSRSPSSRRNSGSGMQFESDAAQAFAQKLRLAAQPDPQIAFEAQMRARHDQHALLFADALGQFDSSALPT